MLRLTSKKTLPVLLFILDNPSFTQTQARDRTGISIGRVNSIVRFLSDRGIVIKENARYHLLQPNRMAELIANTYEIQEYATFYIGLDKKRLLKLLKKKGATLCLESALEAHTKLQVSDSVHIYDDDSIIKELNSLERGKTRLVVYRRPYHFEGDATGKPLTVIDLIAAGSIEQARILSERLWETKQ